MDISEAIVDCGDPRCHDLDHLNLTSHPNRNRYRNRVSDVSLAAAKAPSDFDLETRFAAAISASPRPISIAISISISIWILGLDLWVVPIALVECNGHEKIHAGHPPSLCELRRAYQPYRKKPFIARWYEGTRQRNKPNPVESPPIQDKGGI